MHSINQKNLSLKGALIDNLFFDIFQNDLIKLVVFNVILSIFAQEDSTIHGRDEVSGVSPGHFEGGNSHENPFPYVMRRTCLIE
jgi:hypothetical protein